MASKPRSRARIGVRAPAARESQVREDVAFEAAQAYLRLLRAVRLHDAARANLKRHEALVADFEAIARIDTGRRYDLVQARTRTEQVRLALTEREAEIATTREQLARYFPATFEPAALGVPSPLPAPSEPSAEAAVLAEHPRVLAAQRLLQSAEADARAASAARGPRVDLESTAGKDSATMVTFAWPAFDLAGRAAENPRKPR
ncbi:MAG: TolC family protein [Burkholderiaceae bacterium]